MGKPRITNPRQIELLEKGCLPGPQLYNQLAQALKYIKTTTDGVYFSMRPNGGLCIDVDFAQHGENAGEGGFPLVTFLAYVDSGQWKTTAGLIQCPRFHLAVDAKAATHGDSHKCVWLEFDNENACLESGSAFPQDEPYRMRSGKPVAVVPLAQDTDGGIIYHHWGDIVMPWTPYFLLNTFSAAKPQILGHNASGELKFFDIGECE